MARAERPAETITRILPDYQLNPEWLVDHFVSISNETNREPDFWYYGTNKQDNLIDPKTRKPILEILKNHRHPYLGPVEFEIARELNEWQKEKEEGIAFWISPRYEGEYPCTKVIIHRIAYKPDGEKTVLNSAILFDADFKNPKDLRQTLFKTDDSEEEILAILAWIEKVSKQTIERRKDQTLIQNQAKYFADLYQRGFPYHLIVEEMQRSGFLGPHSISCAPSSGASSPTFSEHTLLHANVVNLSEANRVCQKCGSTENVVCGFCKTCAKTLSH